VTRVYDRVRESYDRVAKRYADEYAGELAGNMAVVTKAINETNRAATEVLDASQAFTAEASKLEQAVEVFLKRVTAA